MEEYFLQFMKEELYLDIIAWVNESLIDGILDNLNISLAGTRLRFKKACQELKGNVFLPFSSNLFHLFKFLKIKNVTIN